MNHLNKVLGCAFVLCATLVSLFSCDNGRDEYHKRYYNPDWLTEFEVFHPKDTLEGEIIDSVNVLSPVTLESVDSLLIAFDYVDDNKFVKVFDMRNDSLLARFGSEGHAGNEFDGSIGDCSYRNNGPDIIMDLSSFDGEQSQAINLSKSIKEQNTVMSPNVRHKVNSTWQIQISKNKYFAKNKISYEDIRDNIFFPPKYYLINDDEVKEINIFPQIVDNVKYVFFTCYSSFPQINENRTKVVDIFQFFNILNIIDVQTGKVRGLKEKGSGEWADVDSILKADKHTEKAMKAANSDACLANEYFFVLQKKHKFIDEQQDVKYPILLQFDYEGNLQNVFAFIEKIKKIAYYERERKLFGITPDGKLYKYDLSKYLK